MVMWRATAKILSPVRALRSPQLKKITFFAFLLLLGSLSALGQNCSVDFPGTSARNFSMACGGTSSNLTLGEDIYMGNGDSFTFDVSANIDGNVSVNAQGNARIVIPSGVTVNVDGNFQLDQKDSGCSSSNPCIFEIEVNGTLNISKNFQNNLVRLVWSGSGTVNVDDNFKNSSNGCMECGSGGCPGFESDLDCKDDGGCSAGDFCNAISNSVPPIITGQVPISINQGESVTITLGQLTVTDPDDNYPTGFTLSVFNGPQYTLNGTTVTPTPNFTGNLRVQVSVNDGENESNRFELTIVVNASANTAPIITGQVPISINQGESVTITLSQLTVTDPDDNYPTGFTLSVFNGAQYTLNGTTVRPTPNFTGNLRVQVSVNDGENESNRFELTIVVNASANTAPIITGQLALTVKEDESISIKLTDLSVVDPDNNFPQDFTLKLSPGSHYTINGNTIVLEENYSGLLTVVVRVNDGKNDSPPFNLQITVVPVNDGPVITGQKQLSANQGTTFSLSLSDLTVIDPDNSYPDDFTLTISRGNNYVAAGNVITPVSTFVGILNVTVSVNDGTTSSPDFNVRVEIITTTKTNVAPTIVAQRAISITQNTSITIQPFHLVVIDPDNEYPAGFSLKVFPGTNYTVSGLEITPVANFVNGTLRVGVQVNDGLDDSPLFELKIQVTPISAIPRINGQKELVVLEDNSLTITLSDLIVTDADNPNYPLGFTLKVLTSDEGLYSTDGNTIRPAQDLNGFIEVGVTVSDGANTSEEFRLSVFVIPVNDAPVITLSENSPLKFEPGNEPVGVFRRIEVTDVDNKYLSMAEIGFRGGANHSPENDELLFESENARIRGIRDPAGILFLIGNATLEEYQTALRTIKYNYRIRQKFNGEPEGILSGPRTIYINVSDGESLSLTSELQVSIEAKIELDIPTAFTPNGDHVNDTWHVQLLNRDKLLHAIVKVYNKRGLLLYEADGLEKNWDATFNGERLPADTYYFTIVIKLPYAQGNYSGVVTVLY